MQQKNIIFYQSHIPPTVKMLLDYTSQSSSSAKNNVYQHSPHAYLRLHGARLEYMRGQLDSPTRTPTVAH